MTEADEKLTRLFATQTSAPDPAFVGAVEARLRHAMRARLALQALTALAFVALILAAQFAWRLATPVLAEVFPPIPALSMNLLGAPAPALVVLAFASLWLGYRRFSRPQVGDM